MKKELTTDFQTRLWTAIKSIERASQEEAIVVLRTSSHAYLDIPLVWGIISWCGVPLTILPCMC